MGCRQKKSKINGKKSEIEKTGSAVTRGLKIFIMAKNMFQRDRMYTSTDRTEIR
jgi:hypothetical protein